METAYESGIESLKKQPRSYYRRNYKSKTYKSIQTELTRLKNLAKVAVDIEIIEERITDKKDGERIVAEVNDAYENFSKLLKNRSS